jgi:hypothetical protein
MKVYRVTNTLDYKSENKVVHEYTIMQYQNEDDDTVTALHRSHDDVWAESVRGEEILRIIDTGDNLIFPRKMYNGEVGYDKLAELYIVMHFMNKTERMPLFQGVIEEIAPTETIEI